MANLKNCETVEEAMMAKPLPSADRGVLAKLHPILVRGILRVGGRLNNALLLEEFQLLFDFWQNIEPDVARGMNGVWFHPFAELNLHWAYVQEPDRNLLHAVGPRHEP